MKVVLAPEALGDIEAVVDYIADDNPLAAAELAERVFAMIERLAEGGLDGARRPIAR